MVIYGCSWLAWDPLCDNEGVQSSQYRCCIRLYMVVFSCIWVYVAIDMVVYGCIWVCIAVYDCVCLSTAVYGCSIWPHMAVYGYRWLRVVVNVVYVVYRCVIVMYMVVHGCVVVDSCL